MCIRDSVIVGRIDRACSTRLRELAVAYENSFDLDDAALLEAYQRCDALIFASTYEGFGMPIVEAQAVGGDGPVTCSCGSSECWEAQASEKALIERYKKLLKLDDLKQNDINIRDLIELAVNGEKHAVEAVRETARFLAIGISNLIVGLSPQVLVVSGKITSAWPLVSEQFECIGERSVRIGLPQTVLMPSSLGDAPTLLGAFGLVLARKFGSAS